MPDPTPDICDLPKSQRQLLPLPFPATGRAGGQQSPAQPPAVAGV